MYTYVDKKPKNFSEAKFRAIWIIMILFNVIVDLLLVFSFVMFIVKLRGDFGIKKEYNLELEEDDIDAI